MSNPKKLHLEQLEEACKDLSIPSPAREKLKDLYEAMARDHATYILHVFREMVTPRPDWTRGGATDFEEVKEKFQQRIGLDYTTT